MDPKTPLIDFEYLLSAISNPARWRILRELLKEPLPTNVIASRIGEMPYNVTKHLKILLKSGIIIRGHGKVYHLRRDLLTENGAALDAGFAVLRIDRMPA